MPNKANQAAMQLLQSPQGQQLSAQISEIAENHDPKEIVEHLEILLETYISSETIESQSAKARSYTYFIYKELENMVRLIFEARQHLDNNSKKS